MLAILGLVIGLICPPRSESARIANYIACRHHLSRLRSRRTITRRRSGTIPASEPSRSKFPCSSAYFPSWNWTTSQGKLTLGPLFVPRGDYGRLDPAQAEAGRTVVRLFLCPSDGQSPNFTAYDRATLAGTNYVVNAGTGTGTYYDFRHRTDGVFWYGSKLGHKDIVDGISSTMFFAEALMGTGLDVYQASDANPRRHWISTGCLASPDLDRPGTNPPLTDQLCMPTMIGMTWRGDRNASWVGGPGHRTVLHTYFMPNENMIHCGSFSLGRFKACTNHPNVLNMVVGDGSVHFIKNHRSRFWRALSTRGDSEAIGSYCGCH